MQRFKWYEPNTKHNYIESQAKDLIRKLQQAGAQFHLIRHKTIMYIKGEVIDLQRTSAIKSALQNHLKIWRMPYERDTIVSIRTLAEGLCQPLPIDGHESTMPDDWGWRYMPSFNRHWIKDAIEGNSPSQP